MCAKQALNMRQHAIAFAPNGALAYLAMGISVERCIAS